MESILKVKHKLLVAHDYYYENGHVVATWDGCCSIALSFTDGSIFYFTDKHLSWLQNSIYPLDEALILYFLKFDHTVPIQKQHTAMSYIRSGQKAPDLNTKSIEIVAHYEKPYDSRPELLIYKNNRYQLSQKIVGKFSTTYFLSLGSDPVASIKMKLFRTTSKFYKPLTTDEKIFLTSLSLLCVGRENGQ